MKQVYKIKHHLRFNQTVIRWMLKDEDAEEEKYKTKLVAKETKVTINRNFKWVWFQMILLKCRWWSEK